MRISWLSPEEISAARDALTANTATWDAHFSAGGGFTVPPMPEGSRFLDWAGITEHVARAERVSEIVRDMGLPAARAQFAGTGSALEAATVALAAHEGGELTFDQVIDVLSLPIDRYVFYAPYLELLVELGGSDVERIIRTYEDFVQAYGRAMQQVPHGGERTSAVRDGLADYYVAAGKIDEAEALFETRHNEDWGDVAVALSASRAFLAAGAVSRAVRWLGVGAARAQVLGRDELAKRLRDKQEAVRKRLS